MFQPTDDLRIKWTKVVLPPVFLEEELPTTETAATTVLQARREISEILAGRDQRLLVVVGPCSIHDTKAALEYASRLKSAIAEFSDELRIVMRVYFEKPRTTVGWKGLINDPHLDGSYKINDGLRLARHLLLDLAEMGVPAGTEFLDMIYAAIHRRPGQLGSHRRAHHREPGAPPTRLRALLPVGFKNGTSGDIQVAIDAILSAAIHTLFLDTPSTASRPFSSPRGNHGLPHHPARRPQDGQLHAEAVAQTCAQLQKAGLQPRVMIDCSHANSSKDHTGSRSVCRDVAEQIAAGAIATSSASCWRATSSRARRS